jgi:hypothetical protein
MTFQTQFEKEFAALREMQDRLETDVKKIFGDLADVARNYRATLETLQKTAPGIERLRAENAAIRKYLSDKDRLQPALEQFQRDQDATLKQIDRCLTEFPSFAQHISPHYPYVPHVVDKSLDGFNGDMASATAAGAIRPLFEQKQPVIDPAAAVGDTELRHRFNQRGDY